MVIHAQEVFNISSQKPIYMMDIIWLASQSYFYLFLYSLSFLCGICKKSMNVCNDQVNYDEIII